AAIKEQNFIIIALCIMAIGVAITGFFPFEYGLYATTVLMSIGYHYTETINTSLTLQWIDKAKTPAFLGRLISIKSMTSLITYSIVWILFTYTAINYAHTYLIFGGFALILVIALWLTFPVFKRTHEQHKSIILRKRYWLYYLLTFLSGARRQIFMVFAGFMMVEKFGYQPQDIALLFIINHLLNLLIAPTIGRWIGRVGEKRALTIEYIGLIFVFVGYALVENSQIAAGLYIIDHLFFAMAIALKTFFQKIANPKDIASTAGVSFTINHIAAVVIPAAFGILWVINHSLVFYAGALLATASLIFSQKIDQELLKQT
ncbi:MAG: MFS transporter, partial [Kangiellaceae bacterium]